MELLKVISDRRSIRKYKNVEISKDIVEDIINCGILAPSAKNRQPWRFIVLTGEKKNHIADIMENRLTNGEIRYDKKILKYDNSVCSTAKVIKEASTIILILREKDDNWIIGDNLSIGACVENMCLRATDLGLGSLWIRDTLYSNKEILKYIGKENMELNCALVLGVQDEYPNARLRKKLEDITEWY